MLDAVPKVVGEGPAEEWRFALKILWESGFRIADLLDFSWDDIERIHPVWPRRQGQHPTLVIPSTQKNGKNEEIPLLPGLKKLLDTVPEDRRTGFVVNPPPAEYEFKSQPRKWFMPKPDDLADLIRSYSNCAIARACGVSDVTVQNWLDRQGLKRAGKIARYGSEVPADVVDQIRLRATRRKHQRPRSEWAANPRAGQPGDRSDRRGGQGGRPAARQGGRAADQVRQRPRPATELRRAVDQPGRVGRDPDGHHAAQGLRHDPEVLRGEAGRPGRRRRNPPEARCRARRPRNWSATWNSSASSRPRR